MLLLDVASSIQEPLAVLGTFPAGNLERTELGSPALCWCPGRPGSKVSRSGRSPASLRHAESPARGALGSSGYPRRAGLVRHTRIPSLTE